MNVCNTNTEIITWMYYNTNIYINIFVSNCNICENLKEITLEILTYSKQYKALENKIIVNKTSHTYFLNYTLFVSQIIAREIVLI